MIIRSLIYLYIYLLLTLNILSLPCKLNYIDFIYLCFINIKCYAPLSKSIFWVNKIIIIML